MESRLALFEGKQLRKTFYNEEWWFSVVDIIEILTDSANPRDYWYRLKTRVKGESEIELSTNYRQLKMKASDSKMRFTDCANTEHVFRIIQSIPSPKVKGGK